MLSYLHIHQCSKPDRKVLLAKLYPACDLRERGQVATLTSIAVYPDGQAWFDDILMSALVIERYRTGGVIA
jgi:hypothetical protein